MSSFGSIAGMIISLKNNKIPKRDHKLGHLEYVKGVPIGKPLKYKNKMSSFELEEFKAELKRKKDRSTKITIIIYLVAITIISFFIFNYFY